MEILPSVDILGGKTVRLKQGDYEKVSEYNSDPVDMVKRYLDHGFNRIHVVDLDGAKTSEPANLKVLEKMAVLPDVKIEWGGGIKTDNSVKDAFNAGASYVCGGTIAVKQPEIFSRWIQQYGHDKIILGADARDGKISINGWTDETDQTVECLVNLFLPNGLSQAIVTDISCDGMLKGPSFPLYVELQDKFPSVIFTVSGGISSISDIEKACDLELKRVIVGKAIYENLISLKELQKYNSPE